MAVSGPVPGPNARILAMIGSISSGGTNRLERRGAAEPGDLLDQRAGDVRVLAVGHQEDGLDRRVEPVVGQRHAELVLHVRERPDAAEDHPRPDPADELDGQLLERLDRDVGERRDDLPGELDALLDR